MSPVLPEDSVLLSIPFGGVVLQKIGVSRPAIDAVMDDFRKTYMEGKNFDDDTFDFLETFRRRLPSSEPEAPAVVAEVESVATDNVVDVTEVIVPSNDVTADESVAASSVSEEDESVIESPIEPASGN